MTPGERLYNELRWKTLAVNDFPTLFPHWADVHPKTRGIYEEAAAKLDIKVPPRADGYYWVRGRDPKYPGIFIDEWRSYEAEGRWDKMDRADVEVLAGPLEPPNEDVGRACTCRTVSRDDGRVRLEPNRDCPAHGRQG